VASANGGATSTDVPGLRIEEWGPGDLPLLRRLLADPRMTVHLGGPESEEKLVDRQAKYEQIGGTGTGRMFKIIDEATGESVGSAGYWDRRWRGADVYETGWMVVPEHQGRGIATRGTALVIERARGERRHRYIHAFPSSDNAASNAICRKLGFTLLETREFEYPPGHQMLCNDWRLDLGPDAIAAS